MAANDPLTQKVKGYPKLAAQIELRPELAIFRRFGALNAENLLYFQAELALLEQDLQKQQLDDHCSGDSRKALFARSWYELSTSKENGDDTQLQLIHRIRETLRSYSIGGCQLGSAAIVMRWVDEALIQQAQILAYPEPDRWDLTYMQGFLQSPQGMGLPLRGPDGIVWGMVSTPKSYSPDLITLCPRQKEDPFSGWVVEKAITRLFCCLRLFKKPSRIHGVIGYEDTKVLKITYWITSVLASLIPIVSIVVLYCVHSMPARLGIIGAFNISLSACLVGFTNAKRAEVFAITAAWVSSSFPRNMG
ncbi:hypothetical protein CC80DRAFT_473276 [Byssothecium circinans]|uniref:DUF6594 domain-containing protein n=1 Tax=Byssothecium circinans TaxID=147558 RepID=A0A6A5TXJ6_9PLEO|nr:hypothetical protein CC80DRAFT_473276 [Byssothecium circinans]